MSRSRRDRERAERQARLQSSAGGEELGIRARVIGPSTAPESSAPLKTSAPLKSSAPPEKRATPRQASGALESSAPPESSVVAKPELFVAAPHVVFDELLATLEPSQQAVYMQLWRLTWGFWRETHKISLRRLAERANVGKSTARGIVRKLEGRKLVEVVDVDFGGAGRDDAGVTYRVMVPGLRLEEFRAALESGGALKSSRAPRSSAPPRSGVMKDMKKRDHERAPDAGAPADVSSTLRTVAEQFRRSHPNASEKDVVERLREFNRKELGGAVDDAAIYEAIPS